MSDDDAIEFDRLRPPSPAAEELVDRLTETLFASTDRVFDRVVAEAESHMADAVQAMRAARERIVELELENDRLRSGRERLLARAAGILRGALTFEDRDDEQDVWGFLRSGVNRLEEER